MKNNYLLLVILECVFLFGCSNKTDGLLFTYNNDTASVIGVENTEDLNKVLVIPSSVKHDGRKYSVVSIEDGAFSYCTKFNKVIIPNSIQRIGRKAFQGCKNLEVVEITNTNIEITPDAFSDCNNLQNKKEILPSEFTIRIHATNYDGQGKFGSYTCNMHNGGGHYHVFRDSRVFSDYITIPEGQRWAYKSFDKDYDGGGYVFNPEIRLNDRKFYRLPDQGRDVVFYPGDRIQIGILANPKISILDVSVTFFVDYQ